jgi:hypothetical protein
MFRVFGAADGGHFGGSELADMACAAFVIPGPRKAQSPESILAEL